MDEAAERTDIRRARAGSYADWAARPHVLTLAFAVMLGIAVLVRLLLTRSFPAPWIMGDELHYSELARSFASNGVMRLREEPSTLRSLYPVLISPAWLADPVGTAYTLTKVINVLLMTSAAIPFFLWSRRLVRPALALAGTLLFLLLPGALYANLIMTESAFLPAFLLSLLLVTLALEDPTPIRQVLAIVSIGLPVAIRAQGVVLVPILLTALVLKVLLDSRASGRVTSRSLLAGLRTYAVILAVVGGAILAYIALKLVQGHGLSSGLSAYAGAAQAHYSIRDVARWSVLHLAELVFAVGVIPASALIVLLGMAWAVPRAAQPRERAFLALTVATTFWMVLLVGAFASHYSFRIEERNMFYAEPLFLLALVIWLDKGAPRPPRLTAAA